MITSKEGVAFIKSFEKFRATMYLDQGGKPTIGWGHLIDKDDVHKLMMRVITLQEADSLFDDDLARKAESCIHSYVKIPLDQCQFDALASLIFNIGCGAFATSTLLKKMYQAEYTAYDIAQEFFRWNKVQLSNRLVKSEGLTVRRIAEKNLFLRSLDERKLKIF
jgi:lysozyme